MAHVTRRQGETTRKQGAAKGAIVVKTSPTIRKKRMPEGAGKAGTVVMTVGRRKHAEIVEGLGKQRRIFANETAASFRGKAFRSLLLHNPEVARAVAELIARGAIAGTRSKKISTRVDPGLMAAAKQRFGLASEADVINASLAVAAAPDRFKGWLRDTQDTLTEDFELAI